jgi:putative ABC transport system permease protein
VSLVVTPRTSREAAVAAIRRALRATDPQLAAADIADLASLVTQANEMPRMRALLLAAFALVALGIVALGSYGLMTQIVASREREFAVRLALGARPARVGAVVLTQSARLTAPGVVLGVALAWPLDEALRPFVFGVGAHSSALTALVAATTLLLVGGATLPAAIRAVRVEVARGLSA